MGEDMHGKKNTIISGLLMLFILQGCATQSSLKKSMEKVNYKDGISSVEAKIIAKKKLNDTPFLGWLVYKIIGPKIIDNVHSKKYPKYWFVEFGEKSPNSSSSKYLVIIDKKTGEIIEAVTYEPVKKQDISWAIEYYKIGL